MATRACDMAQDPIWCEASRRMWRQSSLQTLGAASQRLAMATNRNRCLKRHRLEHPPMAGQGVVTGQPYSDGKGCGSLGQTSGTPPKPQVPVTRLSKRQVLAYRRSLRQVANDIGMNLGTMYGSPSGVGVCDQCHTWGGVPVVVGDRESLSHGEGGQLSHNANSQRQLSLRRM